MHGLVACLNYFQYLLLSKNYINKIIASIVIVIIIVMIVPTLVSSKDRNNKYKNSNNKNEELQGSLKHGHASQTFRHTIVPVRGLKALALDFSSVPLCLCSSYILLRFDLSQDSISDCGSKAYLP